jgi:glycosyltransferase involved in cell wall biosynthesis
MRILHFLKSARNEVGGPARAAIDLCALLSARGHDVTLATCSGADLPGAWGSMKGRMPHIVQLPRPELGGHAYIRPSGKILANLVRDQDLVHVHGMWDIASVQLCREAARSQIPYFITIHGMLDDWSMRQARPKKLVYMALIGSRWLRGAHSIHLTAEAELDQASAWFPRSMGRVIPILLDLEPFNHLPGAAPACSTYATPAGRSRLLFLSRVHPKKGLENLLRALRLLKERRVAVSAMIAGSGEAGYVESVKAKARELGLDSPDVQFLGPVTGNMKLSLYQSADLLVLPTYQENFGLVLIEALACGLPVITTTGVDIWAELKSSGGAVIIDNAAGSIADAVTGILAQPGERRRMGDSGREWVFRHLDPSRILQQFESMYTAGCLR